MNLLHKKYPPSTIMKSYSFTTYLQDSTYMHLKIASNTTKLLVCNSMKGLCKKAKLLTSPIPTHMLASLQEQIAGYTPTDMCNLGNDISDTILAVLVIAANTPVLDSPSSLPLGPHLCLKYHHFIPKTYQEYICLKLSADKIQLIKE